MTTVLILGGLGAWQDATRHLLSYLLSLQAPPAFVRIVDRPLVIPSADAYTCYADETFRDAMKTGTTAGTVEYLQGNLLLAEMRNKAFALPSRVAGQSSGFDWVYDFTGEKPDAPEKVQLERTLGLAACLGAAAASAAVGVYVRALHTCYRSRKGEDTELVGSVGVVAEPWGSPASWQHEAGRALAAQEGLPLVLLRHGLLYGPATVTGVTPRLAVGQVYHYEGEKLDLLWSESLAQHTVHISDWCAALTAAAQWGQSCGCREAILKAHSEVLVPSEYAQRAAETVEHLDATKAVSAAVFSVVDDGETTQGDIAHVTEAVMGVKMGYQGSIVSSFAKVNLDEVTSDVNEKHLDCWSSMLHACSTTDPTASPVSPFIPADLLGPSPIAFTSAPLKYLTGWAPERRLTEATARDTVESFRKEGLWPELRTNGSSEDIPLSHTFNAGQLEWFKAGSALNFMAKSKN